MGNYRSALYSLAFGNFAAGISAMIVVGISSEMAQDLGVDIQQIGHLVTIFAVVFAISAPIIAAISGRVDRQRLLILGLSFVLIGNAIIALVDSYTLIFAGRIISAIGSAIFTPLAVLVGVALAKEGEKGKVSSIIFTGSAVATAIGIPLGTFIGMTYGWRYPFGAVAVLSLLGIMAIQQTIPKGVSTPIANFKTLTKVFRHRGLVLVLMVTVVQFGGQMVLFAYISPWLKSLVDIDATGITVILMLVGVGGIVGNIIAGRATDNLGPQRVQLLLILALIVIMPLLLLTEKSIVLGGVLFLLWGAVGQGFISPQLVRIVDIDPRLSSASLSLNSSFINIGISFGAIVASYFVGLWGVASLTWVAFSVSILSLGVFLFSWRIERVYAAH